MFRRPADGSFRYSVACSVSTFAPAFASSTHRSRPLLCLLFADLFAPPACENVRDRGRIRAKMRLRRRSSAFRLPCFAVYPPVDEINAISPNCIRVRGGGDKPTHLHGFFAFQGAILRFLFGTDSVPVSIQHISPFAMVRFTPSRRNSSFDVFNVSGSVIPTPRSVWRLYL